MANSDNVSDAEFLSILGSHVQLQKNENFNYILHKIISELIINPAILKCGPNPNADVLEKLDKFVEIVLGKLNCEMYNIQKYLQEQSTKKKSDNELSTDLCGDINSPPVDPCSCKDPSDICLTKEISDIISMKDITSNPVLVYCFENDNQITPMNKSCCSLLNQVVDLDDKDLTDSTKNMCERLFPAETKNLFECSSPKEKEQKKSVERSSPEEKKKSLCDEIFSKKDDHPQDFEGLKCLFDEQCERLAKYRKKYLCAQQTVAEQNCKLLAFGKRNADLEHAVIEELQRIRQKHEKRYDKLKASAQQTADDNFKLCAALQKAVGFEEQINMLSSENECLQNQVKKLLVQDNDDGHQNQKLIAKENENLKNLLKKEERKTKLGEEFEKYRKEMCKKLADVMEKAKICRCHLEQQIEQLEHDLVEARANAKMLSKNQEEYMCEMKTEVDALNKNFHESQNQVCYLKKMLHTHSKDIKCS